jgi:uridylate kinase
MFLTDVEGVYTRDPKIFSDAEILKMIEIDDTTGNVITDVVVSGSTHEHDVTLYCNLGYNLDSDSYVNMPS